MVCICKIKQNEVDLRPQGDAEGTLGLAGSQDGNRQVPGRTVTPLVTHCGAAWKKNSTRSSFNRH